MLILTVASAFRTAYKYQEEFARAVHATNSTANVRHLRGFTQWTDGDSDQSLDDAEFLVVFATSDSPTNQLLLESVRPYLAKYPGRMRMVCVLVEDVPLTGTWLGDVAVVNYPDQALVLCDEHEQAALMGRLVAMVVPAKPASMVSPASAWRAMIDVGIISIRDDEYDAVLRRFPSKIDRVEGRRMYNIRRLDLGGGLEYRLAIVRCGAQGNRAAQDTAHAILDELAPRWLFLVGIAGGAPEWEFSLGDVVISTEICDFSVGAALNDGSREFGLVGLPVHNEVLKHAADLVALRDELGPWNTPDSIGIERPRVDLSDDNFYGDHNWRRKVKRSLEQQWSHAGRLPRATAAAIGCSDLVVKDAELLQVWLKIARQVKAVEMESAGVHSAAHERQVPALSIRGLSDIVGFKRDPRWTVYACHSAAALTRAFLETRPLSPRPRK